MPSDKMTLLSSSFRFFKNRTKSLYQPLSGKLNTVSDHKDSLQNSFNYTFNLFICLF